MSESQWIDLALARGSMRSTERIAGAVIDVLIVQEDDDALRYEPFRGAARGGKREAPPVRGDPNGGEDYLECTSPARGSKCTSTAHG